MALALLRVLSNQKEPDHRGSFDSFLPAGICRIAVVLSFRRPLKAGREIFRTGPDSILGDRIALIAVPIGFQRAVHLRDSSIHWRPGLTSRAAHDFSYSRSVFR